MVSRRDPLAQWWRHPVTIERLTGASVHGDQYAAGEDATGFIDDRTRMVRDAGGDEVVSQTTVLLPKGTANVPLGSYVTLPAAFDTRRARVIAASRHDGAGLATPDHLELSLE